MKSAPPSLPIGTRDIDSTPPAIDQVVEARGDLGGSQVDGLEAGGAEAVDLGTGDGLAQAEP
jgi:hypothetical protein